MSKSTGAGFEPHSDVFGEPTVHEEVRVDGEHLVVTLVLVGDRSQRDALLAADVLRSLGGLWAAAGAGVVGHGIDVETPESLDEQAIATLQDGIGRAAQEVRSQRRAEEDERRRWREFAEELERRLGSPPRDTS